MNAEELAMPDWKIRAIFARAGQRHAGDRFLVSFAGAMLMADKPTFNLLRPAALGIIDRFNLAEERRAA